jgi:hypothetical protein
MIDFDHRIYQQTPNNGLEVGWNGEEKDSGLLDLSQILLEMLTNVLFQHT